MSDNTRNALENFEAQFKKSTLPLLVLSVLSEGDMYAYEISQVVLQRSNGIYKMPLLYTTLKKLTEQGYLLSKDPVTTEDNRTRVYYHITSDGLKYLETLKDLYLNMVQVVQEIVYK